MGRLLVLLLLLSLLVAACGQGDEVIATVMPTVDFDLQSEETETDGADADSPRTGEESEGAPGRVPATWTPGAPLVQPSQPTSSPAEGTPVPDSASEETEVPETEDSTADSVEDGNTYVVVAGDTLAEIANRFGVDVFTLAEVNSIENIDVIEVGQRLVIPQE